MPARRFKDGDFVRSKSGDVYGMVEGYENRKYIIRVYSKVHLNYLEQMRPYYSRLPVAVLERYDFSEFNRHRDVAVETCIKTYTTLPGVYRSSESVCFLTIAGMYPELFVGTPHFVN